MRFAASAALVSLAAIVGLANAAIAADPTPVPVAVPSDLPEIGRTKSAVPACSAMRDLIIPSFAAARSGDARFAQTQARLPQYAQVKADATDDKRHKTHDDAFVESALSKLDQDAANLLGYAAFIAKALGDPRIAATVNDPEVQAERAKLQELYAIQAARAQAVAEFVQRERIPLAQSQLQLGDATKIAPAAKPGPPQGDIPAPSITAPPGLPHFSGIAMADKEVARSWGTEMTKAVAQSESDAAKTFLPIANRCR